MNNNEREYILLKDEDIIWFIYFFIAAANLYSNYMQEKNIEHKNTYDEKGIKSLNLTILIIAFIIYIYFLIRSYNNVVHAYNNNKPYKVHLNKLSFYAAALFAIAGLIYIYVEYKSGGVEEVGIT